MRLSLKTQQVLGFALLAGVGALLLGAWYVQSLLTMRLEETRLRAQFIADALFQRTFDVMIEGREPFAVPTDSGMQTIMQTSLLSKDVLYAAITDPNGVVLAHADPARIGEVLPPVDELGALIDQGMIATAKTILTKGGRSFEVRKPLTITETKKEIGQIRVGISTLLMQTAMAKEMRTPLLTTLAAFLIGTIVAMLLAQVTLRPIHIIHSGLARLGRGELDVNVDLPPDASLSNLGDSFKAVSARLAADREELADQRATLESVVENLEDAVALFSPEGALLFANPAMRQVLSAPEGLIDQVLPVGHPYRTVIETVLADRASVEPKTVQVPGGGERLLVTHLVEDDSGQILGVMVVARNLTYLSQVESTLSYSRKLAALGKLTAGIAHEVKNPLNATMIHLELLRMKLVDAPDAMEHVSIIAAQMRRLDEVVQGFLKFTRPEDLRLQPVAIRPLLDELMPIVHAEATTKGIEVRIDVPADLPPASADPGLLQQAFLNLALNACQAMPNGGRLVIAAAALPNERVQILFEDTGVGIGPEQLDRIFDLYYTTKEHGSGIGLSLVYRTVQLHDGDIAVQSTPGRGTTFKVILRQADPAAPAQIRRAKTGNFRAANAPAAS
ncbi:MAG TPA: ATP-binding protein [Vicinamibacterales bacterium]|nr:ATP-binding protein [Vicinamibacterales bacterium]